MDLAVWTLMQEGGRIDPAGLLFRMGILLALYLALSFSQRIWIRNRVLRNVGIPLNVLFLVLLLFLFLRPELSRLNPSLLDVMLALAVFLGITISLKGADVFWFDVLVPWRKRAPVPVVVRDIGRWVISLIALVLIIRTYFPGVNLDVFAMSSLVIGYIVGNATQDTLGNLIAGLALNTERPFQIGDWVTVSGSTGRVVDTTWRATRLRTKAEDYVIIPNAAIAKDAIVNYSRPTSNHGCHLTVGVDYDSPPNTVRSAVLGVLADLPEVLKEPAPSVFLAGYGDFSVNFTIKFFISDYARLDPVQGQVMDRIWYAFRRQGIGIPFPIRDVRVTSQRAGERRKLDAERESVRTLLRGVELFKSLSEAELDRLVNSVDTLPYAAGEALCHEGEAGDTFHVIQSGVVAIVVGEGRGAPKEIARLTAGQFFGEMALLTGERRNASVVAVGDVAVVRVSKTDFAGIIQADADLAGKLAEVLEKRLVERRALLVTPVPEAAPLENKSMLVARIRRFFGLIS